MFAVSAGKLFRSLDNGSTWESVNPGYGFAHDFAVSPAGGTGYALFVYDVDTSTVWRSLSGGLSWTAVDSAPPPFYYNGVNLAVSPNYPIDSTLFATGTDLPFYKSTDGGYTWNAVVTDSNLGLQPIAFLTPGYNDTKTTLDTLFAASGKTVYRSTDGGRTWTKTGPLNDGTSIAAIQPTILPHAEGGLQILCRTRQGRMSESRSTDQGLTWSPMVLGELRNPSAGFDAVLLQDGRSLLVYNHTTKGRHSLDLALSADGTAWERVLSLENQEGEYSYPAIIQSPDGLVHITYTHRRRHIKHVVIDPRKLDPSH